MGEKYNRVVVGFIERGEEILIAQRPKDVDQSGLWEFPGGKCEPGETTEQALVRELKEELGVTVKQAEPLFEFEHSYPQKTVLLNCWRVLAYEGQIKGCEGQLVQWVNKNSLHNYVFLEANYRMIDYLSSRLT
jgi:8-oxo-dGTP diphosphatase